MSNDVVDIRGVCEMAKRSYTTVNRLIAAGLLPKPVIGNGPGTKHYWNRSDIEAFIAEAKRWGRL